MNVLFDTNVVLDVFQHRIPHYEASALALNAHLNHQAQGFFPAHAVSTVDYVLRKYADRQTAANAVDWLLKRFEICPCDGGLLRLAASSEFRDFEDAIVAYSAIRCSCSFIVTRNTVDFSTSPVAAITPQALLQLL